MQGKFISFRVTDDLSFANSPSRSRTGLQPSRSYRTAGADLPNDRARAERQDAAHAEGLRLDDVNRPAEGYRSDVDPNLTYQGDVSRSGVYGAGPRGPYRDESFRDADLPADGPKGSHNVITFVGAGGHYEVEVVNNIDTRGGIDNPQVTLNGSQARMSDLQPGDYLDVSGSPIVTVTAVREVPKAPKARRNRLGAPALASSSGPSSFRTFNEPAYPFNEPYKTGPAPMGIQAKEVSGPTGSIDL